MSGDVIADIIDVLLGDAGVAALVGTRIYPMIAPDGTTEPFIRIMLNKSKIEYSASGEVGLYHDELQIDVIANTYKSARDVDSAVRSALSGYHSTLGSWDIVGVFLSDASDGFVEIIDQFIASTSFDVFYR